MIPYYASHFFPLILERERICMCERENKTEAMVQVYSYPYSLPMEGLTGFPLVLLYEMLIPKAYLLLTNYVNGYHWFQLQKRDRHLCVWLIKMVFLPPFFLYCHSSFSPKCRLLWKLSPQRSFSVEPCMTCKLKGLPQFVKLMKTDLNPFLLLILRDAG